MNRTKSHTQNFESGTRRNKTLFLIFVLRTSHSDRESDIIIVKYDEGEQMNLFPEQNSPFRPALLPGKFRSWQRHLNIPACAQCAHATARHQANSEDVPSLQNISTVTRFKLQRSYFHINPPESVKCSVHGIRYQKSWTYEI